MGERIGGGTGLVGQKFQQPANYSAVLLDRVFLHGLLMVVGIKDRKKGRTEFQDNNLRKSRERVNTRKKETWETNVFLLVSLLW